jgi:hypothetical protein
METIRRTVIRGALPMLMFASVGPAAHSATIDAALVGAWTPSIADCSRLFTRTGRGVSFKQAVDKFAQAAIIRPAEVEGPSSLCSVSKVTRAKDTISATAECRDSIGYLSETITIKVKSAREIIYSASTGVEALNVTYLKCPM